MQQLKNFSNSKAVMYSEYSKECANNDKNHIPPVHAKNHGVFFKNFKYFCQHTHFHGFADLVRAKTKFGKAFWAILIVVSLAMTGISIFQATENYLSEPVHLTVEHRPLEDMAYPPLKLCFPHWFSWFNWAVGQQMNFTKHEIFFALSFMSKIYTEEYFDVLKIEESFMKKLALNDIGTIEQFFKKVAHRRKNIFQNLPSGSMPEYEVLIDLTVNTDLGIDLCYRFSEVQIKQMIYNLTSQTERSSLEKRLVTMDRIILALNYETISPKESRGDPNFSWLSDLELMANRQWNHISYFTPFWIMPNGYTNDGENVFYYPQQFLFDVIAISLKDSDKQPCHRSRIWITSNNTCLERCKSEHETQILNRTNNISENRSTVFQALRTKKIFQPIINTLQHRTISDQYEAAIQLDMSTNISHKNLSTFKQEVENIFNRCAQKCKAESGCDTLLYTISKTWLAHFKKPAYLLNYPSNMVVMKEVNFQNWETFISDIGGLLGIWMGASILTIFQIFYLCCCNSQVHPA